MAMFPLFFSGIVEVVGFATSTIFGALLGLVISRPAYAAIVEKLDIAND
jgi:preprotein translocase subunit SecD